MPIVVACPGCRTPLSADERMIGRMIACPRCGGQVPIEPSAAPPASSRGGGAGTAVVVGIVIAVVALFGLLAIAGISLVAVFLFVGTSWTYTTPGPAVLPPTTVAVPPTGPYPSPPMVAPPVPGIPMVPPPTATSGGEGTSAGTSLPENPQGLTIDFPAPPVPFDPIAEALGASVSRPSDTEGFLRTETAKSGIWGYRATSGGTKYELLRLPLNTWGQPIEKHLEGLAAGVEAMQPGFAKTREATLTLSDPSAPASPPFPAYQVWLVSPTNKRISRVVPIGDSLVQLNVEGPATMADDDSAVDAFFDGLGVKGSTLMVESIEERDAASGSSSTGGPASGDPAEATVEAVASALTDDDLVSTVGLRTLPERPVSEKWNEFAGERTGFRVSLPVEEVVRPSLAEAFERRDLDFGWQRFAELRVMLAAVSADSEMIAVQQPGRRFLIFAVEDDGKGAGPDDVAYRVGICTEAWIHALYPSKTIERSLVESDDAAPPGTLRTIHEVRDGPTRLPARHLTRTVGKYGIVLVYESDRPLADDDPVMRQFFESLVDPESRAQ